MQGYRVQAPPSVEVKLGPLPMSVLSFVAPVLIALVALALAGCTARIAMRGPEAAALRCSRTGDAVACEEWRGAPMKLYQRFAGPLAEVRFELTPGRNSKSCVAIRQRSACGGRAKQDVARLQSLAAGETVELDSTDHSPTTVIVGSMFAFLLLVLSGAYLTTAFARRNVSAFRITPTAVEVLGKRGEVLEALARGRGESVVIVPVRAGRGELPKAEIAFGTSPPYSVVTSFMASDHELEVPAAKLRQALAEVPPV